jgi:outer membrane lipoprotein-sorting protein
VEARVTFSDRLFEGAELAGGGDGNPFSSSPLISGASGRLWVAKDGRVRLELQADRGDTQVIYDGKTVELFDATSNTLYRYAIPQHEAGAANTADGWTAHAPLRGSSVESPAGATVEHEPPSVAKIEEALSHASEHANLSGATPTDVAGQAAYTLRVSPKESGSLIGGAEVSWDAVHGVPLRAALFSTKSSTAVIELTATDISYGPVDASVFDFTPPPGAIVKQIGSSSASTGAGARSGSSVRTRSHEAARAGSKHDKLSSHGRGITSIAIIESPSSANGRQSQPILPSSLPKVKIGATSATELATALGTILSFERNGVRYVLVGALPPAPIEALARGF